MGVRLRQLSYRSKKDDAYCDKSRDAAMQESELALGLTLLLVMTICGQEIAHLVGPALALVVLTGAFFTGIVAYTK